MENTTRDEKIAESFKEGEMYTADYEKMRAHFKEGDTKEETEDKMFEASMILANRPSAKK